jgi:hypothetical protein
MAAQGHVVEVQRVGGGGVDEGGLGRGDAGAGEIEAGLAARRRERPVEEGGRVLDALPAIMVPTQSAKPVWTTARASAGTSERRRLDTNAPREAVRESPISVSPPGFRGQVCTTGGYPRSLAPET